MAVLNASFGTLAVRRVYRQVSGDVDLDDFRTPFIGSVHILASFYRNFGQHN